MGYVFLDLEWNNAFSKEHGRFINEIIEIGAVKFDENMNELSRFDTFVRSRITKRLGTRFKNLTNITNEEMKDGVPLREAVDKFKAFCGDDFLTITWSTSDLYAIVENFRTFLNEEPLMYFGDYLDLQRFYGSIYPAENHNQIALKSAAEQMNVPLDSVALHRASDDSAVTAEIFRAIRQKGDWRKMVVDTRKPDFYERLTFRPYLIDSVDSPYIKPADFCFQCKKCRRKLGVKTDWKVKNKQFYGELLCKKCGTEYTARVRIKKCYDSTKVKKTLLSKNEQSSEAAKQKAAAAAEKSASAMSAEKSSLAGKSMSAEKSSPAEKTAAAAKKRRKSPRKKSRAGALNKALGAQKADVGTLTNSGATKA